MAKQNVEELFSKGGSNPTLEKQKVESKVEAPKMSKECIEYRKKHADKFAEKDGEPKAMSKECIEYRKKHADKFKE